MYIPGSFRTWWSLFFSRLFPQFVGGDNYVNLSPIQQAFVDFSRLALAFGIVWLVGWALTKIIKEVFG